MVTFAISVQIRTINNVNTITVATYNQDRLKDEVFRWKQNYENINNEVNKAEKQLETIRKSASEKNEGSSKIESELNFVNRLLGLTVEKGKGIEITLNDNKAGVSEAIDGTKWYYLVHDEDIKEIINDLKNGGAEAICVNNQRIVNTTGIICDGNVVRINGEKVSAPYVIKAIGSPESLMGAVTFPGAYIEELIKVGVTSSNNIKKVNDIEVPKYEGKFTTKYIRNVVE